ncbi:MAG TPA: class I SAM-dependent methyltransferase [Gemmatimonadaceae bacterium]|nr:class I SAM-dependent methyltransferase [Gemmatimonadaceae bacterium]
MRERLLSVYASMRNRIVPGLRYSQAEYEELLNTLVQPGMAWLDVGCGHQVLPPWRADAERALVGRAALVLGLDGHLPSLREHRSIHVRIHGDISALPFEDRSFDLVTANMVVEHLAEPEVQLGEMARVLRPGGLLALHTPNLRGYPTMLARAVPEFAKKRLARMLDGREEDDVFPTCYRANTVDRICALGSSCDLEPVTTRVMSSEALLAVVPPLAFVELLAIRLLSRDTLSGYRSNILAVLRRRGSIPGRAAGVVS